MTLAAGLSDPRSMMLTLVEAGAHLDFRNNAGQTAVHRAAKLGNDVALQVALLQCGQQFTGYCKTDHQLRTVLAASESTFILGPEIAVHFDS